MRKIKTILIIAMVLVCCVLGKSSVAEAQGKIQVKRSGMTISVLSEKELLELASENVGSQKVQVGENRNASYTAYRCSETFDFYDGDLRIARAVAECILWEYTDGKVHLYSRTITPSRIENYEIYRTYGRIVNTDGSLSYTTGDSVNISSFIEEWDYAIDFYATPAVQYFSCYPI